MDGRIRRRIEYVTGLPFETFPNEGVKVVVSDARSERPKNRLLVQRVMGKNGVLVTGTPRILKDISRWLNTMTSWEIFSPLGIAEMKRRLSLDDSAALDEDYGLDYYLSEREEFLPFEAANRIDYMIDDAIIVRSPDWRQHLIPKNDNLAVARRLRAVDEKYLGVPRLSLIPSSGRQRSEESTGITNHTPFSGQSSSCTTN